MSVFLSRTQSNKNYQRRSVQVKNLSARKQRNYRIRRSSQPKTQLPMQTSKPTRLSKRENFPSSNHLSRNLKNQAQSPSPSQNSSSNPFNLIIITLLRLAIVGAGLGTIMGTVLANVDLTQPLFPEFNLNLSFLKNGDSEDSKTEVQLKSQLSAHASSNSQTKMVLNEKLTNLEAKFATLKSKYAELEPGAFFVDLDNGAYADFNGETIFSAASTIKIPILIAFFQDIDAGKIYLDQELVMDQEVIVGGSGNMQYQKPGQKYTAIDTATEMIVTSDNTATEMIIRLLGGRDVLNKRFQSWGLQVTAIRNPLPDLEGKNTTSPRDLAYILTRVNNGELISLKSRDRLLDIMQQTKTKTLLPQGIEKEAIIAHKTGDIGSTLGDAGIIDIPTGKRYVGAVLVKRPHNDYSTRTLIQEISRTAYQHFKWYLPHPPLLQNKNNS